MREMIRVREADQELRIQVLDGRAYVAIMASDEPEVTEEWTRAVSLPARRLHALLRAAWADDQYGAVGALDPPLWPADDPEPDEDPYRQERLRFGWRDDWPDDPLDGGWSDPVPFPGAAPWPPHRERPARSGSPWSAEDDATLRRTWLGATADTDRAALMADLAARFERTTGGVLQRLHRVGCDPGKPGSPTRCAPSEGTGAEIVAP